MSEVDLRALAAAVRETVWGDNAVPGDVPLCSACLDRRCSVDEELSEDRGEALDDAEDEDELNWLPDDGEDESGGGGDPENR